MILNRHTTYEISWIITLIVFISYNSCLSQIKKIYPLDTSISKHQEIEEIYNYNFHQKVIMDTIVITIKNENLKKILKSESNFDIKKNQLIVKYSEFEKVIQHILSKTSFYGHPFSKIKLKDIASKNNKIYASLLFELDTLRTIDKFVIIGYDKFPEKFREHLLKKNTIVNEVNSLTIQNNLDKLTFINITKDNKILFKRDSTILYSYIKKKNTNYFDGLIGFQNEVKKIKINGYLNIHLNNIFDKGSEIDFRWKSNSNKNQELDLSIKTYYLYHSKFDTEIKFNIQKQDSSFINLKTELLLSYKFNNQSLGIITSYKKSNSLTGGDNEITNFNKTSFGLNYQNILYSKNILFNYKLNANLKLINSFRHSNGVTENQNTIICDLKYNIPIYKSIYLNSTFKYGKMFSKNKLINDQFSIGGQEYNRGIPNNSIITTEFSSLQNEFRYSVNKHSYFYFNLDHLYNFQTNKKFLSLGLGLSINRKIGQINLNYSRNFSLNTDSQTNKGLVSISLKNII